MGTHKIQMQVQVNDVHDVPICFELETQISFRRATNNYYLGQTSAYKP